MKTAIYIEDGVVQFVLTPENDFERQIVKSFVDKDLKADIFSGAFYDCRGGWIRQTAMQSGDAYGHIPPHHGRDVSLIIRTGSKE